MMVHCWMLHGTVRQHNNSVCGGGDGGVAKGGRANFRGRPQHGPVENGRTGTGQVDFSGVADGGA